VAQTAAMPEEKGWVDSAQLVLPLSVRQPAVPVAADALDCPTWRFGNALSGPANCPRRIYAATSRKNSAFIVESPIGELHIGPYGHAK